jgi:hypothetical protein
VDPPSIAGTTSQRDVAAAALLRPWLARTVREARAGHAAREGLLASGDSLLGPSARSPTARQVALALHSVAVLGADLGGYTWAKAVTPSPVKAAAPRDMALRSQRRTAKAVAAAVRWVLLPEGNLRDLTVSVWALAAMRTPLPPSLLRDLLVRIGALLSLQPGSEQERWASAAELSLAVHGLGRLMALQLGTQRLPGFARRRSSWMRAVWRSAELKQAMQSVAAAVERFLQESAAEEAPFLLGPREVLQLLWGLRGLQHAIKPALSASSCGRLVAALTAAVTGLAGAQRSAAEGAELGGRSRGTSAGLPVATLAFAVQLLAGLGASLPLPAAEALVAQLGCQLRSALAVGKAVRGGPLSGSTQPDTSGELSSQAAARLGAAPLRAAARAVRRLVAQHLLRIRNARCQTSALRDGSSLDATEERRRRRWRRRWRRRQGQRSSSSSSARAMHHAGKVFSAAALIAVAKREHPQAMAKLEGRLQAIMQLQRLLAQAL